MGLIIDGIGVITRTEVTLVICDAGGIVYILVDGEGVVITDGTGVFKSGIEVFNFADDGIFNDGAGVDGGFARTTLNLPDNIKIHLPLNFQEL